MENQKHYSSFDKFVLRTPLFPLGFVHKLTSKDDIPSEDVKELCNIPLISEALYIASPPLYYEMQKWIKGEMGTGKKAEKKTNKLKGGIVRYFLRMSTRCTPFGLFAGFTTGEIDSTTNIGLWDKESNIRHTRLDMNYMCALATDLSKHNDIKNNLRFYPNSSLYIIGEQIRYIEYKYINSSRNHNIVAIDNSAYVQKVLKMAGKGASIIDLAKFLVEDDISLGEAKNFIEELVESQMLLSEFEPSVTGDDFLDQFMRIVTKTKHTKNIANILDTLNQVKSELENIRNNNIGNAIPIYEAIAKKLKRLGTKYELKHLFQTDMVINSTNCLLNSEIVDDLQSALEVFNKLTIKNMETNLSRFRDAFNERYEGETVPLLQALDTETGIGYLQNHTGDIAALVDDLAIPANQSQSYDLKWNKVNSFLHRKYIESLANKEKTIEILDKELESFTSNWDDLPETISVITQIFKSSSNKEYEIFVKSVGGSSAANLSGRFCHTDKGVRQLVNEIIEKDEAQNQEVIFAEIAHLPESRTGNILHRPILRKYEIPYLAKPSVDEDCQIKLEDLYLSVHGQQIYLRSKRLNKIIVPRLTSAHNYSYNALPVYQFLCDLQTQNQRGGLHFNWGPLEMQHIYLPRVIYKNIILSRASWNFRKTDIEIVLSLKEDYKRISAFQTFMNKHQLPDEVLLADSDNELYLNLKNKMCIKILLGLIKNRQSFTFKEFLFNNSNLVVNSTEGGFTNEFVISFYKNKNQNKSNQSTS